MTRLMIVPLVVALSLFLAPGRALACFANGVMCSSDGDCCGGNCDPYQGRCGLANDSPCTSNSDCAGEVCVSTSLTSCSYECKSGEGLPCSGNTDCIQYLYFCNSSNVCVPAAPVGTTGCTNNDQCVTNYCAPAVPPNPRYCGTVGVGQPCDAQDDCYLMGDMLDCDLECTPGAGWCCIEGGQPNCSSDADCCSGTCVPGSPSHCV